MKVKQPLFTHSGFSGGITVMDNKQANYPSFIKSNKYGTTFEYSVYLNFFLNTIVTDEKGNEERIFENFTISFFDMYRFRKLLQKLIDILESDFYEEYEHVDRGTILRIKPEVKKEPLVMIDTTKKFQIGFVPIITYSKKRDEYSAKIRIFINRTDVFVALPVDIMLGIAYNILEINLHTYAVAIINAVYSSKAYHKKLVIENQRNISVS